MEIRDWSPGSYMHSTEENTAEHSHGVSDEVASKSRNNEEVVSSETGTLIAGNSTFEQKMTEPKTMVASGLAAADSIASGTALIKAGQESSLTEHDQSLEKGSVNEAQPMPATLSKVPSEDDNISQQNSIEKNNSLSSAVSTEKDQQDLTEINAAPPRLSDEDRFVLATRKSVDGLRETLERKRKAQELNQKLGTTIFSPESHDKDVGNSVLGGQVIEPEDAQKKKSVTHNGVKLLYATTKELCDCCVRWSEYADSQTEKKEQERLTKGFSIVHRQNLSKDDHKKERWETHSILVRGNLIQRALVHIFEGYPGLDLSGSTLVFFPPFKPVIHRWEKFNDFVNKADGQSSLSREIVQNIRYLRDTFATAIDQELGTLRSIRSTGIADFESLWYSYSPGEKMVTRANGLEHVHILGEFRMLEPRGKPRSWLVILHHWEWNGHKTGFWSTHLHINEYKGSLPIVSLEVVPLHLHPKMDTVRRKCIARGRKFEALRGYHFKHCVGRRVVEQIDARGMPHEVLKPINGRVIVDALAYYECQEQVMPTLQNSFVLQEPTVEESTKHKASVEPRDESSDEDGYSEDYDEDEEFESESGYEAQKINVSDLVEAHGTTMRDEILTEFTEDQYMLASARVKGMDVKTKEWSEFFVDDLKDIDFNQNMYRSLVLPGGEKELALAAVKHRNSTDVDVDFVKGKGRGLVLLLYGPPGVGKSFTVEAVAEELKVPLYAMTAGDLGTKASQIEAALNRAFRACTLWKAVLLLDEADVFLAARNNDSLDRNEIVSVFLRTLEHYQGILFLTTNRMENIDHAFQSRIDFILPYDDLSESSRREVWTKFIQHVGTDKFSVTSEEIDDLIRFELNGREIKNLVKSAFLLALEDKSKITADHLRKLAVMRKKARLYIQ